MRGNRALEIVWSSTPILFFMAFFAWGAILYLDAYRAPKDATIIYVIGKQWMWKFQHPGGQREINTLHVPAGRPIKLLLTSEDVIHSFFVPDFRVHMDVLPDRYTSVWFNATRPGEYHLFCSQYCGTNHSSMTGRVIVMRPTIISAGCMKTPRDREPLKGKRRFSDFDASVATPATGRRGRRNWAASLAKPCRFAMAVPLSRMRSISASRSWTRRENCRRLSKHYAHVQRAN